MVMEGVVLLVGKTKYQGGGGGLEIVVVEKEEVAAPS